MMSRVPPALDASKLLRRVEVLLDEALADLTGNESASPCSRSVDLLSTALHELQAFDLLSRDSSLERATFRPRLESLLPRLSAAERLLSAAAEFYRGWCAAGTAPSYPVPGYQTDHLQNTPALLALEG